MLHTYTTTNAHHTAPTQAPAAQQHPTHTTTPRKLQSPQNGTHALPQPSGFYRGDKRREDPRVRNSLSLGDFEEIR